MGNRWRRDWPNRVICLRQRRPLEFPLQITARHGKGEEGVEREDDVQGWADLDVPIGKTYVRSPCLEMKIRVDYKRCYNLAYKEGSICNICCGSWCLGILEFEGFNNDLVCCRIWDTIVGWDFFRSHLRFDRPWKFYHSVQSLCRIFLPRQRQCILLERSDKGRREVDIMESDITESAITQFDKTDIDITELDKMETEITRK